MNDLKNLKKYIPKRKYRERGQLESRKRKGFLEKKQDYKIRADDHHRKEKHVKNLIEKARTRNPDEFYFQMNSSKMINGENMNLEDENDREKVIKNRVYNHQKILNLVNHKKNQLSKLCLKLENETQGLNELHLKENFEDDNEENENDYDIDTDKEKTKIKHKIFIDSYEEVENFDGERYFDSNLMLNTSNRLKKDQLQKFDFNKSKLTEENLNQEIQERSKYIKILYKNKENLNKLQKISSVLEFQKNLIKPGKKKKEGDGIYNYRFFNERKK